jgi:hypothetical protein
MKRSFALYRTVGQKFVEGLVEKEVFDVVDVLNSVQRAGRVSGAMAEIGVHRGKFLIGLHLLRQEQERSVAIDLFEDQHLNVDKSGKGDLRIFLRNVSRRASTERLVIHRGDSTELDGNAVRRLAGSSVRLFSVDGGHTEQIVFSDMKVAEAALAEGGVLIADDVFNPRWPGVVIGTARYLLDAPRLAPFAIGFNKVFFSQVEYCQTYRSAIDTRFSNGMFIAVKKSRLITRAQY